ADRRRQRRFLVSGFSLLKDGHERPGVPGTRRRSLPWVKPKGACRAGGRACTVAWCGRASLARANFEFRRRTHWQCTTNILASHGRQLALLLAVHSSLGRLHIKRGAGLDLDEAQRVAVPAHQVNFTSPPPRAEVARHNCVSHTPQVKVGSLLAAPPRNKVRRRLAAPRQKPGKGVEDAERELEKARGHRAESPILRCTWDGSPIIPTVATTADYCVGYETSPNHFTGSFALCSSKFRLIMRKAIEGYSLRKLPIPLGLAVAFLI